MQFLFAAQFTVTKDPKINQRGLKMIKGIIDEKNTFILCKFI